MLVLTRKPGESIFIGDDIEVTITKVNGRQVHIGIAAPRSMNIRRGELEPHPKEKIGDGWSPGVHEG